MKKVLFSLSALFAFGLSNAQDANEGSGFKSGDTFITGTVSFDSQKTGNYKTNEFNFSPSVGYFISDNIALGIDLTYTSGKDNPEGYDVKTTAFGAGVFGRYYFTTANKFNIFAQLGAGYVNAKQEVEAFDYEEKGNGFVAAFSPGFNYWVSNHFALEARFGILSYTTVKPDADGADNTDTFSIGLDLSDINFGVVYKF